MEAPSDREEGAVHPGLTAGKSAQKHYPFCPFYPHNCPRGRDYYVLPEEDTGSGGITALKAGPPRLGPQLSSLAPACPGLGIWPTAQPHSGFWAHRSAKGDNPYNANPVSGLCIALGKWWLFCPCV